MKSTSSVPRAVFILASAAVVVLFLPVVARSFLSDRPDWAITELLINYRAGFVRRGLLGELLLRFCDATGVPFFTTVAALFTMVFAVLIVATVSLLRPYHRRFPALTVLLLLSPALLMFPVHEWPAFHRKESFIVGLLLLHAIVVRKLLLGRMTARQYGWFLALGLTPALGVIMFIHEAQLFYLAPHACMTFVGSRQRGPNWRLLGFYAIPCLLAGVMVLYSGNADMIDPILASVAHHVQIKPDAETAIAALGWPMARFFEISFNVIAFPGYAIFYLGAFVLAVILPALALGQIVTRYATNKTALTRRWLITYLTLIIVSPLPLILVWSDFGRLIHVMAFGVTAFLLAIPIAVPEEVGDGAPRFWSGPVAAVIALLYVGAWMLPHFEPPQPMVKSGLARSVNRSLKLMIWCDVDEKRAPATTHQSVVVDDK